MIARKYPDMRPLPFIEPSPTGNWTAGDLTKMLGLASIWRDIPEVRLSRHAGGVGPRLVLVGDSFVDPLAAYLAPHFGEMVVSNSGALNSASIERQHPGVVLFEMVERKLNTTASRLR